MTSLIPRQPKPKPVPRVRCCVCYALVDRRRTWTVMGTEYACLSHLSADDRRIHTTHEFTGDT